MALPVVSKVLEAVLDPEDAEPIAPPAEFVQLFKDFGFSVDEMQALNAVSRVMRDGAKLAAKFKLAMRGGAQILQFLKLLKKRTAALQVGDSMVVPGASGYKHPISQKWIKVSLMYIIERTTEQSCRFVVVNTDVDGGLAYHESSAAVAAPTISFKVCMALDDVSMSRVQDDAWWLFVLKLVSDNKSVASTRLYDLLLPWLTDKPLEQSFAAAAEVDYRQPHDNDSAFYRCVTESMFYLLRRKAFTPERTEQVMFAMRSMMLLQADRDLYHSFMGQRESRFLKIAWQQYASCAAELGRQDLLSVSQLLLIRDVIDKLKEHVRTRLMWQSWSEQAELNEMHVFASTASRVVSEPARVLFISSIADGGHENIADSLMKESRNLEKVMSNADGGLKPALPIGYWSAIDKYSDVQAKLKECAELQSEGPLILHFSSHGNDDDQSIRFEGNTDIELFAKDIANAKPALVVLSACLTLPLGLKIWEASEADAKPTIVCWAKPVGTVVAEVFTKHFYKMVGEAAATGKVAVNGEAADIDAGNPLALRLMLHEVGKHKKLVKELSVVDEPEAAGTRDAPRSTRSDGPPPALDLKVKDSTGKTPSLIPFFETLRRKDDVEGLAGAAGDTSTYVPVNFLRMPQTVTNIAQAVRSMRLCDELCSLIHSQRESVKNAAILRACLIEHVFIHLVPLPLPQPGNEDCIWSKPMTYAQQLDIMILLQRIMENFASAAFSLHSTKSFDAVRIVVAAAIAAVADCVMRRRASDMPSAVSTHLLGETVDGSSVHGPFGIDTSTFAVQSETCEVHTPELNIARSSVLDYFGIQTKTTKIFSWEDGNKQQKTTNEFLDAIAQERVYSKSGDGSEHRWLDNKGFSIDRNFGGTLWQLHKNFPEFGAYRDVCFYFKFFLNPDNDAFPQPRLSRSYQPNEAALHWEWNDRAAQYIVGAKFGTNFPYSKPADLFQLSCVPKPVKSKHAQSKDGPTVKLPTHRYPSGADVTLIVDDFVNQGEAMPVSINVKTEDDILHLRNLPTFDDSLTASDAELLLSFLTEPYLRIPLVLSFFATEDRIHALKHPRLRTLLDAVLWEPGHFSSYEMSQKAPQEVPTSQREQLATAHGLMLNELQRSPAVVLQAIIKLLKLALDLNTGTVHGSTTEVILFVCRLACRFDSYASFVIDVSEGTHQTMHRRPRDFDVSAQTLAELKHGVTLIRALLHGDLLSMIKDFSVGAYREYHESSDEETLNMNTRIMCCLHGHLILATRNLPLSALNSTNVKHIMASFVHLNCRHSFNTGRHVDLPGTSYFIPETELYETLQCQRRRLVEWCQPVECSSAPRHESLKSEISTKLAELGSHVADETSDPDAVQAAIINLCNSIASLDEQLQALPAISASELAPGVASSLEMNDVMNAVQTITSDTGSFAGPDKHVSIETAENWGFIDGSANVGRFTVTSIGGSQSQDIVSVDASAGLGAEIDFQLGTLTLKNAHVVALSEEVANEPDVRAVFGNESMQATILQSAANRVWYRLMGRGHDIQHWCTNDDRKYKEFPECFGEYEREYFEDLHKDTEMWMAQIFEPIRKAYFCPPGAPPIRFLMRTEPAKESTTVISMLAVHPSRHGAWKEVIICKNHKTVQCYEIISHGRRWYKSLQYCNDRRFALRCLSPDMTFVRRSGWPEWGRHAGGHPLLVHQQDDITAVITRSWGTVGRNSRNLSGGVETFIPDRLLFGILPEALLDPKLSKNSELRVKHVDRYEFWQGEDDRLRGYPVSEEQQHLLLVDLQDVAIGDCTLVQGTRARIKRVSKQKVECEYGESIKLCELVISSKILAPSALGAEPSQTNKAKKKIVDKEEAPVSFELFRFIQSLVNEFGLGQTGETLRTLASKTVDTDGDRSVTFETRSDLRTAIEKNAAEASVDGATDPATIYEEEMELLDLLYAEKDSQLYSLATVISRLETLAHVLCWSRNVGNCNDGSFPDAIELPRLSLTFITRTDQNGKTRLESSDHAGLYIHDNAFGLDKQITDMLRGMPQSLVLTDSNGQHTILCAALPVLRPVIPDDPFSTELVLDRQRMTGDGARSWVDGIAWAKHVDKYFLYPVHVSKTFLLHRSLASALYLLVLRLLNRNYQDAFSLANAISTDKEYSLAERCIFSYLAEAVFDQHPDANACRLHIAHAIAAVPKVKSIVPWDVTMCMSQMVLSLQSISASTRIPRGAILQLLELCCNSVESDDYNPRKGHNEYKIALVANYKSLLSAADSDTTMAVALPARTCGNGWPYLNNTLVYKLDKSSPSGSNMAGLREAGMLQNLLAKTSGELLVLLIHEQPRGDCSDAIYKAMLEMSTDRAFRTVIFRHMSIAALDEGVATAKVKDQIGVKSTPQIVFYSLEEDETNAIDASLVGSVIRAKKRPLGFRDFKSGKTYDAEVIAVNDDGTLHLRYDGERVEDTEAPASLTDFGRDASDKLDQLVVQPGQTPETVVSLFKQAVERLMTVPEDQSWQEDLIFGDLVDVAIDASLQCKRGHPLVKDLQRNTCDMCGKGFRDLRHEGLRGTDWRCGEGCDYDLCQKCHDKLVGTSFEWYRGVVVGCTVENITVHFELLPNDKNTELHWSSNRLRPRGKSSGSYHYSKMKPNPEDEEDESVKALWGHCNSGLTKQQFRDKQITWSWNGADGTVATIDERHTRQLERGYWRSRRLGLEQFTFQDAQSDKEYSVDLIMMIATETGTGVTRKLTRMDPEKADDPTDSLLAEYMRLVEDGSLSDGKESCTLVVADLCLPSKYSSADEFGILLGKLKRRSDALLPDDGWCMGELQKWCKQNGFVPPAELADGDANTRMLISVIQDYLHDEELAGPASGFDRCVEWKPSVGDESASDDRASSKYLLEYPTATAANKARQFIQDQPYFADSDAMEFEFHPRTGHGGSPIAARYHSADTNGGKNYFYAPKGFRVTAKNVVAGKSATDGLFIEVGGDPGPSVGGPLDTGSSTFYQMESSDGIWTKYTPSSKSASADILSALKMKSGSTWARISKHWKDMTLSQVQTRKQTGYNVIESVSALWDGKETCSGDYVQHGFLYLYSIFTGKTQVRIIDQDNRHTLATLFTRLLTDCDEFTLLPSILNQMSRNPELCDKLAATAVFNDRRKRRETKVSSEPLGDEPSPLAKLFVDMIPQIVESQSVAKPDATDRATIEPLSTICAIPVTSQRGWIVQTLSDYSNARRIFNTVAHEDVSMDAAARSVFMSSPLQSVVSSDPAVSVFSTSTRAALGLKPLPDILPFDVSKHEQARSDIAKSMLTRMQIDVKEYADAINSKVIQSLACLTPIVNKSIATPEEEERAQLISEAEAALLQLQRTMKALRTADQRCIDLATPTVLEIASQVTIPPTEEAGGADLRERCRYLLRRESGHEPQMIFEFVVGALLSSNAIGDLQLVNPYLSESAIQKMLDIVVVAILSANRVSQINRCFSDIDSLQSLLRESRKLVAGTDINNSLLASLDQKSQSLATQITAKRHYIEDDGAYDPRFLVFEYVGENQIMLRKAQVDMVRMFVAADSVVKQMIMGAGKTTVIAPLLTLMLADGQSLVMSVVPKALLEMSRNVMRSTFSSIVQKRVYTLVFDRGSDVPPALFDKLDSARRESGVVIATPTTLKSIQLKFLELLCQISDVNRPRVPQMVEHVELLHKVLGLFKHGVLLMDEVDVILHPLKSELNFPVGIKHDLDGNPARWELPMHMIDCIFFADQAGAGSAKLASSDTSSRARAILDTLLKVIDDGVETRALQKTPHIILLNPDWYHEQMKPIVADWVLLWLQQQNVGKSGLSDSMIKRYILNGTAVADAATAEEREHIEKLHAAVGAEGVSESQRKILNLSHDWLQHYFPHCLQKIDRVTFGVLNKSDYERIAKVDPNMPDTRRYLAIPFEGKDVPSKSSEFAHPDITIGLTILGYRYEGLRYTDFDQIMNSLRATLAKEVGPYSQRKSSLLHAEWVTQAGGIVQTRALSDDTVAKVPGIWQQQRQPGGLEWQELPQEEQDEWMGKAMVVPLRLLKRSNSGQMHKLFKLLQFEPKVVMWYLQEIVFPTHMRHQVRHNLCHIDSCHIS